MEYAVACAAALHACNALRQIASICKAELHFIISHPPRHPRCTKQFTCIILIYINLRPLTSPMTLTLSLQLLSCCIIISHSMMPRWRLSAIDYDPRDRIIEYLDINGVKFRTRSHYTQHADEDVDQYEDDGPFKMIKYDDDDFFVMITNKPTHNPTQHPTLNPTNNPTLTPTHNPTAKPTTSKPTRNPTQNPTNKPTQKPIEWDRPSARIRRDRKPIANASNPIDENRLLAEYAARHSPPRVLHSIELYRYDSTNEAYNQHIRALVETKERGMLVIPRVYWTASDNSSLVVPYLWNSNDLLNALSHYSPDPREGLRLIQQIKQGDKEMQKEIKFIEHTLWNTTYARDGKIPKRFYVDFTQKKQNLKNITHELAKVFEILLQLYESEMHSQDISHVFAPMVENAVQAITAHWVDLSHLSHSLQIASIVYRRKGKKHTPIVIVASDVHLTADLLSNLGYSKANMKMMSVSTNKPGGYSVPELLHPPNHKNSETMAMAPSVGSIHVFVGNNNTTISAQVEIFNDLQYELVMVDREELATLCEVQDTMPRFYLSDAKDKTSQMFGDMYGSVVDYIADVQANHSALIGLTFNVLSNLIQTFALNPSFHSLFWEIMNSLNARPDVHPKFAALVMEHYMHIVKLGVGFPGNDGRFQRGFSGADYGRVMRSIFIFWKKAIVIATREKIGLLKQVDETFRSAKMFTDRVAIGITAVMNLPKDYLLTVVEAYTMNRTDGTLQNLNALKTELHALLSTFAVVAHYCRLGSVMTAYPLSTHSSVAIICTNDVTHTAALEIVKDFGFDKSVIHIHDLSANAPNNTENTKDSVTILKKKKKKRKKN
eukprot:803917_1